MLARSFGVGPVTRWFQGGVDPSECSRKGEGAGSLCCNREMHLRQNSRSVSGPWLLLGVWLLPVFFATAALSQEFSQEVSQGDDKSVPARDYYKNIQLFVSDGVSASYLDQLMLEISTDLGVSCSYCHDEGAPERRELSPEKVRPHQRIEEMWRVVMKINQENFKDQGAPVRCWSCHRGAPKPERNPQAGDPSSGLLPGSESPFTASTPGTEQPASSVFKNLSVLQDRPASSIEDTMELIATSLGVECGDCHVEGDYASDAKPLKQRARTMLVMAETIDRTLFPNEAGPTCWTCHRGQRQPEFLRPELTTISWD